ncbi:hypothetical protein [Phosphitispora fastidiosa]|uniref:hypothetical protein n=1 Tax=Phosphitispora fastidiosa TaxID=2837202 RepID=UPI001E4F489D|nr:hypothetical protein [Phosphitispora fastidiosa]MBU7006173.1 hypothetical protein [Phosphitispora fastidiosa]
MLSSLSVLKELSRIGIIEKEGKLIIVILARPAHYKFGQLVKMGCIFDGGYVFMPPDGAMAGTYEEVVLPSWVFRIRREYRRIKRNCIK